MMKLYQLRSLLFVSTIMISLTSATAFGQSYPSVPQMEEVSGKYSNDDVGVRITFPDGWSGIAMETPQGTMATVSPGGMESQGTMGQAMTLMMSEKAKVSSPPTDPTQGKSKCDTPTTKPTTVSGAQGTETVMTCTLDDVSKIKEKIISSQTETHWISVMFMAPISDYDGNVGKFDDSVKTLNILNVMDSGNEPAPVEEEPGTTTEPGVKSSTMPVTAGGNEVNIDIQSPSEVSNLALDEANKKLSFSVSGDTDSTTTMSVGNVLQGPYAVMIDGQLAKDYTMADDKTIILSLLSGSHDISISGTQVVPEFPLGMAGLIVGIVGMVAVLGRTKILGKIKY